MTLKMKNSGKITNYNIPKSCCNYEFCGSRAYYFVNLDYNGFSISLMFCTKHYAEFNTVHFQSQENQKEPTK